MATTQRIRINGVVDTKETVLANINNICNNSACFLTWDPNLAKWRVIINEAVNTAAARIFDDTNIVGSINQTGVPFGRMYNIVNATFPHVDLRGTPDTVRFELISERYTNELDNELNVTYSLTNDPVQAEYLANIEVKQSRLDKIVRFTTDYQGNGLYAGEVIRVSNPIYGYVNKLFRIVTVEEADGEAGEILFNVTALEYDPSIYSSSLTRDERNKVTGITPFELNTCVQDKIAEDLSEQISSVASPLETGIYGDYYNIPQITIDENKQITKIENVFRPGWTLIEFVRLGYRNITIFTNNKFQSDDAFFLTEIFEPGTTVSAGFLSGFEVTDPAHRYDTGIVFTVPKTGRYHFNHVIGIEVFAQSVGGEILVPERTRHKTQMDYIINGVRVTEHSGISWWKGGSFGEISFPPGFRDTFDLNEGDTVEFVIRIKTELGPDNPECGPQTDVGWGAVSYVYYYDPQYDRLYITNNN